MSQCARCKKDLSMEEVAEGHYKVCPEPPRQFFEEKRKPPSEAEQFFVEGWGPEAMRANAFSIRLHEAKHGRFYFITQGPQSQFHCGKQMSLVEVRPGDSVIYSEHGSLAIAVPDAVFQEHYQPVVQSA